MADRKIDYKRGDRQDVSKRGRKWPKEKFEINMVPMNYFLHRKRQYSPKLIPLQMFFMRIIKLNDHTKLNFTCVTKRNYKWCSEPHAQTLKENFCITVVSSALTQAWTNMQ
jgi:hypothetical protein